MSLRMGTRELFHRMTSGWYLVGTPQPIDMKQGSSVTIKFDTLQQVLSDAQKAGMVAYVKAFGFNINWRVSIPAVPAVVGNALLNQTERMCALGLDINQPNLGMKYLNQTLPLAAVNHIGRTVNPRVVARTLKSFPTRRPIFPNAQRHDGDSAITAAGLAADALVRYDRFTGAEPDDAKTFGDNDNIQTVASPTAQDLDYNDVVVMPLCMASGRNKWGDEMEKDHLPLSLMTDNSQPWSVTVGVNQGVPVLSGAIATPAIFPGGIDKGSSIALFVFLSFTPISNPQTFGVTWGTNFSSQLIAGMNFQPRYYRGIFSLPKYNNTGGSFVQPYGACNIQIPYEPVDPFSANAPTNTELRIFDGNNNQVFPLTSYSNYSYMCYLLDVGAEAEANPLYYFGDVTGNSSQVFVGGGSAFPNPHRTDNQFSATYFGVGTTNALIPVVSNLLNTRGFAPGIMSAPGNAVNDYIQVQLGNADQFKPASANVPNVLQLYVADQWQKDVAVIRTYVTLSTKRTFKWVACVDGDGPFTEMVAPLVPQFGN